jgi:hypothetical protein
MGFVKIVPRGEEPSVNALEPIVVAYLKQHGPTETTGLANAVEAAWVQASGEQRGGDPGPVLKRVLDGLADRGIVVQERVFGVWRLVGSEGVTSEAPEAGYDGDAADADVRRPSLSALLTEAGIVTDEQIREALAEGEHTGEKLGEVVVRRGWASEEQLACVLAQQWGLATVDAAALELDPLAVARLDPATGAELGGFPVRFGDAGIVVAIAEPTEERLSAFRELFDDVSFVVVSRTVFRELAQSRFGGGLRPDASAAERIAPYTTDTDSGDLREPAVPPIPAVPDNAAVPHEAPTPPIAAASALTERLTSIAAEVAVLEHALEQAQRMIETRDSELADLREANEQHLTTIHLLEQELADRSRRFDGLREKVADLNLALEP